MELPSQEEVNSANSDRALDEPNLTSAMSPLSGSSNRDIEEYEKSFAKHKSEKNFDAEGSLNKKKYEKEIHSSKYGRSDERRRNDERRYDRNLHDRRESKRPRSRSGTRYDSKFERNDGYRKRSRERYNERYRKRYSGRTHFNHRDDMKSRGERRSDDSDKNNSEKERPIWATKEVRRHAQEINRRKLLWSKTSGKDLTEQGAVDNTSEQGSSSTKGTRSVSAWNSILAASASDSGQLDKFKRLMGIKKVEEEKLITDKAEVEAERERQKELYNKLDEQYTMARSLTHLGRGHGLGFNS